MNNLHDAIAHLDEALRELTAEVYHSADGERWTSVDGMCTIVMDLQRIDAQIGAKGETVFARMAESIQSAYVEIKAARAALEGKL